jgi:CBS-domain-containing membrane protein
MNVSKVMTRRVITVTPRTPLKDVARLLVQRRVSGVPVVDEDGTVLGVVSEGDILVKERSRTNGYGSLLDHLFEVNSDAYKHDARDAADAMTSPPVTIRPDRAISEAAALMLDRCVNRLPVVDRHGKLVGIVTRADLVRAYVRPDEEIVAEIREDVLRRTLWIDSETVDVEVEAGEVHLAGTVVSKSDAELIPTFVERVPGVVSVLSKLTWPDEASPRSPAGPGRSRSGRARRVFRA